jgi:hypothetical protein
VAFYVHARSTASVSGISGDYDVHLKTGHDWNSEQRGFTRECGFQKFKAPFNGALAEDLDLGLASGDLVCTVVLKD